MSLVGAITMLFTVLTAMAANPTYVDATTANTQAVGGSPSPFWTTSITSDNLWRFRTGFGFDEGGQNGIYEKDGASGGYGDAAKLVTTISGLSSGTEYGVYVNFLTASNADWAIQAGLDVNSLSTYTQSSPTVTNLGLTSVSGSNRYQLQAFIGNAVADSNGQIDVYIDDTDATNSNGRTWYDGVSYGAAGAEPENPVVTAGVIVPDGVWTWFNDERAIWHNGKLYVGYVKKNGRISVTQYNPVDGLSKEVELSSVTEVDDHNNPSLHVLPDGRIMASYSRHSKDNYYFYRISNVTDPDTSGDWGAEQTNGSGQRHSYANTYAMSSEGNKIYTFTRGIGWNPNWTVSSDNGVSWSTLKELVRNGGDGTRPYVRYTGNGVDSVDFIYSDGHPRDENNSIYHARIKGGNVLHTDGSVIKALSNTPLLHDATTPERGTVVYQYSTAAQTNYDEWVPGGRAWAWDIQYQKNGDPVIVFSVQVDNATGSGWNHDRIGYYYARWNGSNWEKRFIAHAGRPLYSSEDDYAGGVCIDPERPNVVYISSNAMDPFNRAAFSNVTLAANERYEIWKGTTLDGGLTFSWEPVTYDSTQDNIRPFVPRGHSHSESLLWLQGTYSSYTSYNTKVVGKIGDMQTGFYQWKQDQGYGGDEMTDSDLDGSVDLLEYAAYVGGLLDAKELVHYENGVVSIPAIFDSSSLNAVLESSVDLNVWQTVAASVYGSQFIMQSMGYDTQVIDGILYLTPSAAPSQLFYRMRVTHE